MIGVVPHLLERAAELHRLHSAVDRAAAGRGVTVLVTGEPGIVKTSLLQTFVAGSGADPAGLTNRQVEILRLLSTGISNAEIAQRLVVSTRTVDHHVSAILQTLGVRSRREAANQLATLDATDQGRRAVSQISSTS